MSITDRSWNVVRYNYDANHSGAVLTFKAYTCEDDAIEAVIEKCVQYIGRNRSHEEVNERTLEMSLREGNAVLAGTLNEIDLNEYTGHTGTREWPKGASGNMYLVCTYDTIIDPSMDPHEADNILEYV